MTEQIARYFPCAFVHLRFYTQLLIKQRFSLITH